VTVGGRGNVANPSRAAVSPARGGIGSCSAAGRADLGAEGFQCAFWDASGRALLGCNYANGYAKFRHRCWMDWILMTDCGLWSTTTL
jgi:hypothetical protein